MYRFKNIEHNVTKYIPKLIEKLRIDEDITAVYLFGSYAESKQTVVSDIDIAILLDCRFPPNSYFEKKLDLLAAITSLLKTDEVDLVIMNQAPPAVLYQILSKGQLLYENNDKREQRVSFQVLTLNKYFDFQPIEKILHEGLVKRIKEGRFGG